NRKKAKKRSIAEELPEAAGWAPRQNADSRPRSHRATRFCSTTFVKSNCAWWDSSVTSRCQRRGAEAPERVSADGVGAHLGLVAVRFDLYNRARNVTANSYERPARQVGGGIEFDHPCAAENARGAPSVKRLDHLAFFAFARVVHDEEGCHLFRALTNHAWRGVRHRHLSRPQSSLTQSIG